MFKCSLNNVLVYVYLTEQFIAYYTACIKNIFLVLQATNQTHSSSRQFVPHESETLKIEQLSRNNELVPIELVKRIEQMESLMRIVLNEMKKLGNNKHVTYIQSLD